MMNEYVTLEYVVASRPPQYWPISGRRPRPACPSARTGSAVDSALRRRVVAAAKAVPEVRAEHVARLRAQIAAGAYHVPDELLAQRLLGRPD